MDNYDRGGLAVLQWAEVCGTTCGAQQAHETQPFCTQLLFICTMNPDD